jgi:hypothetical protein
MSTRLAVIFLTKGFVPPQGVTSQEPVPRNPRELETTSSLMSIIMNYIFVRVIIPIAYAPLQCSMVFTVLSGTCVANALDLI